MADESASPDLTDNTNLEINQDRKAVLKALREAKRDRTSEVPALDQQTLAAVDDMRADTGLKKLYAHWFIAILIGQLAAMNILFLFVGLGSLNYPDSVINLFMGGTLGEVFGVVFVITKYLFSKR